jgi:hypothetical protein
MRPKKVIWLMGLSLLLMGSACATYDSAVPASAALGAGAGALLGYGLTGSGLGAAAGAGAGALAGAITGVSLDESRRPVEQVPQPIYEGAYYEPQNAPQAYDTFPDPTVGEFFNNTRWRLEIFVDGAADPMFLTARQSRPVSLDVGHHQVAAKAYVHTQFGERFVGGYDNRIYVDPRGAGWSMRFDEAMF